MKRLLLVHVMTVPESLGFLRGQIHFMRERGIDTAVITSPGPGLDEFVRAHGIVGHGIEMARQITPLRDLRSLYQLRRLLKSLGPDIVHVHTPKASLLGSMAAFSLGVPVRLYHLRGLPMLTATGVKRWVLAQTERIACFASNQVFCVSNSVREVVIQEGLCPKHKIKVLGAGSGNGVDAENRFNPAKVPSNLRSTCRQTYGIPEDAFVIGFLGRLVRDKGVMELLEAFRVLSLRHPHLHLLIAGGLEARDAISQEALATIERHPRIHWKGHQADARPVYAAMDVLALPSYREGFGNVLLEAGAMRLPVVASRIPGISDAVRDGQTGTLVPVRDPVSLAAALERYMLDPQLAQQHGGAGRDFVVKFFRPEAIWQALYDEYMSLRAPA